MGTNLLYNKVIRGFVKPVSVESSFWTGRSGKMVLSRILMIMQGFRCFADFCTNRREASTVNTDTHRPLEQCSALVLNADYQPLSYFPLSLVSWQDALRAMFRGSVTVVSEYERVVRSPTHEIRLPSVLALKEYVPNANKPAFTRFNLFLRDAFHCQYCGDKHRAHELTFDHVIPRSRGGLTSWDNIVTACQGCNLLKGNKMPHECRMYPRHAPRQPSVYELRNNGKQFPPNYLHESWGDFLYWDTELED